MSGFRSQWIPDGPDGLGAVLQKVRQVSLRNKRTLIPQLFVLLFQDWSWISSVHIHFYSHKPVFKKKKKKKKEEKVSGVENKNSARYRSANPGPEYCSWIQQRMGYVVLPCCFRSAVDTDLSICSIPAFVSSSPNLFFPSFCSGQAASPGSQQTSNPDYSTWVDVYRQPMAFFSQGAQTQAPGLQVRSDSNVQMLKDQPVSYGMHSVLYSWSKY